MGVGRGVCLLVSVVALSSLRADGYPLPYSKPMPYLPSPFFPGWFPFFRPTRWELRPLSSDDLPLHTEDLPVSEEDADDQVVQSVNVSKLPPWLEVLLNRIQDIFSYYNYLNHQNQAVQ